MKSMIQVSKLAQYGIVLSSLMVGMNVYADAVDQTQAKCEMNDPVLEVQNFKKLQVSGAANMKDVTRIYYGEKLNEFGDLRLPKGKGPFPVAIIVHGGAWQSSANLDYLAPVAEELRKQGIATWNIEYSRLGSGGEWPYSFHSVGQGVDYLHVLAQKYPLDLGRVISVGHSSGGHYALWAAARQNLSEDSTFYRKNALKIKGVISLDGSPNLDAFSKLNRGKTVISKLLGEPTPDERIGRLLQTSPSEMDMSNIQQYFITQYSDRLPSMLEYIDSIRQKKGQIDYKIICKANHFTVADMSNHEVQRLFIEQAKQMTKK